MWHPTRCTSRNEGQAPCTAGFQLKERGALSQSVHVWHVQQPLATKTAVPFCLHAQVYVLRMRETCMMHHVAISFCLAGTISGLPPYC